VELHVPKYFVVWRSIGNQNIDFVFVYHNGMLHMKIRPLIRFTYFSSYFGMAFSVMRSFVRLDLGHFRCRKVLDPYSGISFLNIIQKWRRWALLREEIYTDLPS
jgi:hypothetical protein